MEEDSSVHKSRTEEPGQNQKMDDKWQGLESRRLVEGEVDYYPNSQEDERKAGCDGDREQSY